MLPILNPVNVQKPREIALQVLRRQTTGRQFVEHLLDTGLADAPLSPKDRALCQELVYGAVRWQVTLDWLIARKTAGRTQKTALQILLRLGLYQLFWLDRVPEHAAVHETVELAKRSGFGAQAGFINALLRGYARERETTERLLTELKTAHPALGCSHPEWLWERWRQRWGAEKAIQLMDWNNAPPKIYARVNTLKADPGKLLTQWRDENVEYDFFFRDWLEENSVFELKSHPPLATLPSFQDGWFYVQDPSTLLAGRNLDPQPGESVLDFCAAPGGKTTFMALLMRNEGRIVAADTSNERLKLVRENCARLGVTCVEPVLLSTLGSRPSPQFDRVLVDAPCSNTGVMRRRVDLRWRIKLDEINRLRRMQADLLRQAAAFVKPGGVLVYSTCSLESEENQEVVKQFLREHPDFKFDRERELLPFADGVDGAYVARLMKPA